MTRSWSCYRLHGLPRPGEPLTPMLTEALPRLVGYLMTADAGSRWFFQHHNDSGNVEVAFHSTASVRRELERQLLAESHRHGWPVLPEDPGACPAACPPTPPLADQLAVARAGFVRDLGRVEPDVELAALHLHKLLDLVPMPDRRQFLFTCWETWSRRLSPQQRIALGVRADRDAAAVAETVRAGEPAHVRRTWYGYLTAIRAGIATRPADDTAPLNYLLFDHAHRTHRALGIDAAAEAVAARALRTALVAPVRATIPMPSRELGAAALSGSKSA